MDAADWKLRDARNRERFALRRGINQMAAEEWQLARTLHGLDQRLDLVENALDEELRREHWGHEPERLPRDGDRTDAAAIHAGAGRPTYDVMVRRMNSPTID